MASPTLRLPGSVARGRPADPPGGLVGRRRVLLSEAVDVPVDELVGGGGRRAREVGGRLLSVGGEYHSRSRGRYGASFVLAPEGEVDLIATVDLLLVDHSPFQPGRVTDQAV